MGTTWPDQKSSTNRKKMIGELVRGRELAAQLQSLLHEPLQGDDGYLLAEELVVKIMRSFTETLSVLSSSESAGEVCQNPGSEDSGETRKRSGLKDRRGCYKRRKTSQTWTIVSPSIEDDYAWRKYGQKGILNAKYPRSYFRCTHKHDQGCRATKQVQRIEEETYRTTYIGYHTCKGDTLKADSDPEESKSKSNILNIGFDSKIPIKRHILHPSVSSSLLCKEESVLSDDLSESDSRQASLGSILLPNSSMAFESSVAAMLLPPDQMGSDNGDVVSAVYSCTETSNHSLDMDFIVGSTDNYFHFDESEFL